MTNIIRMKPVKLYKLVVTNVYRGRSFRQSCTMMSKFPIPGMKAQVSMI